MLILLIKLILKKFGREDLFYYMVAPIILLFIGFCMRLLPTEEIVDLGFFFTEVSNMYLYVLFVLALLLGQLKYWKK